MIYVIGSGPSGLSCTLALLEKGHRVTMLDGGGLLEPEKQKHLDELAKTPPAEWRGDKVRFLKAMAPDRLGVKLKLAYGSDFAFQGAQELARVEHRGADSRPSLAKGGLSNVWGAVVLPYRAEDIGDWPVTLDELAPHYRDVFRQMDLSASEDDLAAFFPLYADQFHPLAPSRQAAGLLACMGRHKQQLNAAGVWFGASRLAVRAGEALPTMPGGVGAPGCVYCGMCLHGCPYQLIYNSALGVDALVSNSDFQYVPGVTVQRLEESGPTVRVFGRMRTGERPIEWNGDRVYLACGPVASTQILLESLEAFDRPLTMPDSCLFLMPMARLAGAGDVAEERLHTLTQAFIEILDPAVCPRTVHIQIYTYNDLFQGAVRAKLGRLYPLARPALRPVMSRLLAAQGYLHSDFSPPLKLTLSKGSGAGGRELILEGAKPGPMTTESIARATAKLRDQRKGLGAFPLARFLEIGAPGRGFHTGGSFPMRNRPAGFESDVLGRPCGFKRVHVVDSSIFPSIPATTITLSAMANARRIASRHDEL